MSSEGEYAVGIEIVLEGITASEDNFGGQYGFRAGEGCRRT